MAQYIVTYPTVFFPRPHIGLLLNPHDTTPNDANRSVQPVHDQAKNAAENVILPGGIE